MSLRAAPVRTFHARAGTRGRSGGRARGALVILATMLGAVARGDGPPAVAPASPTPTVRALLIGCTEYPKVLADGLVTEATYRTKIRLAGCANDVDLMRSELIRRLGAKAADITTLVGWSPTRPDANPTRAHIVRELEALATRTYAADDLVVIHYAGHGVQVPDQSGDEPDGLDEAWFVADSSGTRSEGFTGTILDDELGAFIRRIRARGPRVWLIADCCHAATGMRLAEAGITRTRRIDPETLGLPAASLARPAARGTPGAPADSTDLDGSLDRIVAFYAVQTFQEEPEIETAGPTGEPMAYGLLTASIARGLERSRPGATYGELYEHVVAGYREFGAHHRVQPFAEGDLRTPLLDGATRAPLVVRRLERGVLELSAGSLFGLAAGTELVTHASGLEGKVTIVRATPEASIVVPTPGTDDRWLKEATSIWPAEVSRLEIGASTLPIAVVDASGSLLDPTRLAPALRVLLDAPDVRPRHPLVDRIDDAAWLVEVDANGAPLAVRPARAGPRAPRFRLDARSTLASTLFTIYRGENLLRLADRSATLPIPRNLRLRVARVDGAGKTTPLASGTSIRPGTRLKFELVKEKARPSAPDDVAVVDANAFWIDPLYCVYQLFPRDGASPQLDETDADYAARGSHRTDLRPGKTVRTTDDAEGLERVVVLTAPARHDATPLNLSFLEGPPLTPASRSPVGASPIADLLTDLAGDAPAARGVEHVVSRSMKLGVHAFVWNNAWGAIRAPARAEGDPIARIAVAPARPSPDGPPDAWELGPDVRLARAGAAGSARSWCVLVAEGDGTTSILVDVDGEVADADRSPDGLRRIVSAKAFGADIAIRQERSRTVVSYDTDGDGVFDLAYVDDDLDGRADAEYRRVERAPGEPAWRRTGGIDAPLLSTPRLAARFATPPLAARGGGEAARNVAIDRLRAVTGD